jgi:hypothetical protein
VTDTHTTDTKLSISLERLLFGAIALNLIMLMCSVICTGGFIVVAIIYALFFHHLRGFTLFLIALGGIAIVSQFTQFCLWGARGFLEMRPMRIGAVGFFFVLYGGSAAYTGAVDGYIALGTVALTTLVLILVHWNRLVFRIKMIVPCI